MMTCLRSLFFAGAYDSCIESIPSTTHATHATESDKRSYLIRSLVLVGKTGEARSLLKPPGVLDEALLLWIEGFPLKSNSDDFQKWSAILMKADLVRAKLEGATQEEGVHEAAVLLSHVYGWAGNQEIAYALCAVIPTLEAQLLVASYLAKIYRFDLADRKLEKLRREHGEDIAFQLVQAEIAICKSGSNIQDALYIYQEAMATYGRTPKLMIGQAAALILLNRMKEAENIVLDILQDHPHHVMALSYLIHISVANNASLHIINDQLARLAAADASAPLLKILEEKAKTIELASAEYLSF